MIARPLDDATLDRTVDQYRAEGWARLGVLADDAVLETLRARADDLMLGRVVYDGLFFQHDGATGRYEDLPYGEGWQGPSLAYRKIEKLEKDPLFWAWIGSDVFRRIAERVYGPVPVSIYRAMLMNKHAGGGSDLPFHQDGGAFWGLDRDPTLQLWTALDDAPLHGGCLTFVPRSHLGGLATSNGGVVPRPIVEASDAEARAIAVPVRAGEVLVIHNHVWHRSGRSESGHPRRAISVAYMDAATRCRRRKHAPRAFVPIWSPKEPTPNATW